MKETKQIEINLTPEQKEQQISQRLEFEGTRKVRLQKGENAKKMFCTTINGDGLQEYGIFDGDIVIFEQCEQVTCPALYAVKDIFGGHRIRYLSLDDGEFEIFGRAIRSEHILTNINPCILDAEIIG